MTACGPLDLPGSIGEGRRYADLLASTVAMDVGDGAVVRVLELAALAALRLLRRTLAGREGR